MLWNEFTEAASATSWTAYVGTSDGAGNPHVAVVAPGFTAGSVWFATRPSSKKFRNLTANSSVAFHWPVGGDGPGELFARGSALLFTSLVDRQRLWSSGTLPFDLSGFWTGPDDNDLAFVEAHIDRATLIGPSFEKRIWKP